MNRNPDRLLVSAQIGKALPTHVLQRGRTLLVDGPASIRIETGECSSLGATLSRKEWLVVRGERRVPVETETGATLEIRLGEGSKMLEVPESTIPTGWSEASQIANQSPGLVVILGDVDSGKSTLCAYLANKCIGNGRRVSVIDGDIGQADIGPPTTISGSHVKDFVLSLQDLNPESSIFIGDTSPSSIAGKLSRSLVRLRDEFVEGSDVLLVNTDGWVRGDDAVRYKMGLIDDVRPDLVLGIGSNGDIEPLLELQGSTVLKLNRSRFAKTRDREERKRAREFGYKRFLQNATRVELTLSHTRLRRFDSGVQLKIVENENLRGILAGLLDDEEKLLSIGRIEGLQDGVMRVRTTTEARPRTVELGSVLLSPSYEEIGYKS